MSSVSKSAGAVPVHKSKAKAAQTRRGLLYALPDWLMIIVLFFVPIVLLVVMACSRWSLLGGNRGVNFPGQLRQGVREQICSGPRFGSRSSTP